MKLSLRGRASLRALRSLLAIAAIALAALGLAACGGRPAVPTSVVYVRARAVPDPPPPAPVVVRMPAGGPQPGQIRRAPSEPTWTTLPSADSPEEVVAEANRHAAQAPDREAYFNAIAQYAYEPGSLYQVYAAPMRITDIVLEPGEKILGQPASGDIVRWVLAATKSMQGSLEQWHVYVKPTRPDLQTNLAINTDKRSYMLELHSYADTYMASVTWRYPQEELERLQNQATEAAAETRSTAPIVSLDALNFNYAIQVVSGTPSWTPVQVFDDGRRTFIRFPETMRVREAPALFVLRDKETQLVNYRVRGSFYVIDRLLDAAELRVGQQNQEVVRMLRTRAAGR
jgi:type IV secretion system protein VirB9